MSNTRIEQLDRFAEMFKALSNPNRLSIFASLITCCRPEQKCCSADEIGSCVGELGSHLPLAASTVSHHLKELYRAGLVKTTRRGQKVLCCVNEESLKDLKEYLDSPAVAEGSNSADR